MKEGYNLNRLVCLSGLWETNINNLKPFASTSCPPLSSSSLSPSVPSFSNVYGKEQNIFRTQKVTGSFTANKGALHVNQLMRNLIIIETYSNRYTCSVTNW